MVSETKSPALRDDSVFFRKSGFFKLYLFLIVILVHSLNFEAYGLADSTTFGGKLLYFLEMVELYVTGLTMPGYFFISGYGFMANYSLDKTLSKWEKRVRTLFIPWLLWNSIMWLAGIAMESIPAIASKLNSGFGYELSLRSWLVDGLIHTADGTMWFISNLMVITLLCPLIYILIRNKYLGIVAIAAGFVAVHLTQAHRYSVLVAALFFSQAAYYSIHFPQLVQRSYGKKARIIAWGLLLVYMLTGSNSAVQNTGLPHVISFSYAVPAMWIAVGDVGLSKKEKVVDEYRFWLFASHYMPLECVEKLWYVIGGVSVTAAWIGMIMCPTVTVLILIGAGYLVKRYCYPLWCVLNGKQIKKRRA